MKHLSLALMCFMLLFASCSKDEAVELQPTSKNENTTPHFVGVKRSENLISTKGVAERNNLWHPCAIIKVKFLEDGLNMAETVKTYAKEWEQHIGVKFDFVTTGDADVRINFGNNDTRYITWSYIGTDCKTVTNQNEATLSFSAELNTYSPAAIKGNVLRAFGQVLGLELESRNINFIPQWGTDRAVKNFWMNDILDLDWEAVKKYVYDPLIAADVLATEYDAQSIMNWPFPTTVLKNGTADGNTELSATDIKFISELYPACEDDVIVTIKMIGNFIEFYQVRALSDIVVDWGDGTKKSLEASYGHRFSHSYLESKEHIIKFYGAKDALINLSNLSSDYNKSIIELDVSKNINLEGLSITGSQLTEFDISKNLQLKSLFWRSGLLTKLDLSKNTKLTDLYCDKNKLTELDLSKNTQLTGLNCDDNQIAGLDLSAHTKLWYASCSGNQIKELYLLGLSNLSNLDCRGNQITTLDVSKNTKLELFFCGYNQLSALDVSKNVNLTLLDCGSLSLTTLDVSKNIKLTRLSCSVSGISSIDLSNNTLLETFNCQQTNISNLDVSKNLKLKEVDISQNPLSEDQAALTLFVESLPVCEGVVQGIVSLNYLKTPIDVLALRRIAVPKNWEVKNRHYM